MKPVKIKKVYDVICPYCYLGMRAFEEASKATGIPVEFKLQPFLLHNGVPYEGVRIGDYLGHLSQEQRASMYAGQQASARALGVQIKDGDDLIVRNSVTAHIAIKYAERFGKSDDALRALFKAHFTDQKPIDRESDLIDILSTVIPDLDVADFVSALNDPENAARVREEAKRAQHSGVQSVPNYVVNGVPIGGSRSAEEAADVLRHIAYAAA